MIAMATYSFYNEIEISECPLNFYELKKKIKELYFLSEKEIDDCIISYLDSNGKKHYILNGDQYEEILHIIESIVLKIEITDSDKYLTIDPLIDEEYELYKLDTLDTKDLNKNNSNDINEAICYDSDEINENEEEIECEEEKKEDSENVHVGIECSICGCKNIKGIRYLCGICSDYNMCEDCEKIVGKEHNHPLLKIRKPNLTPLYFSYKLTK